MSTIGRILEEIHERYQFDLGGALADYIPELTKADPNWFGISLVTTDGHRYQVGNCDELFTIQSISKAFIYGMALDERGIDYALARIGVEPSGEAFNEISLEEDTGRPFNPMINAGAIAATAMIPGQGVDARFERIRQRLSLFAGRDLSVDEDVYRSESETGFRNRAIAYLLRNSGIIDDPVEESVEVYFKQCSVQVTCNDLALMGATMASAGVNPITQQQALAPENVDKVLSVMSTCGMYDSSGEWSFSVGLPAKSGVGGGILGVLPGQMGLAVFSPLLDPKGNSVRGLKTFAELSRRFNLNLFNIPTISDQSIRTVYQLSSINSNRQRPRSEMDIIRRYGDQVTCIEMQGDLFFSSMERALRTAQFKHANCDTIILDLSRVGLVDSCCLDLLCDATKDFTEDHKRLFLVDPKNLIDQRREELKDVVFFGEVQMALERSERDLLSERLQKVHSIEDLVPFHEFEIFAKMSGSELSRIESLLEMQSYQKDEMIICNSSEPDYLFLLAKGLAGVYVTSDGQRHRVHAFSPGVSFGDLALIDRTKRSADVIAEKDSLCFQIPADKFHALETEEPVIHAKIVRNLFRINLDIIRKSGQEIAALRAGGE